MQETQVDVSYERRYFSNPRDAYSFPGYRVVVHVPFEGEADVFKFQPSSFNLNPPRARVRANEALVTIEYARDAQPDIDGQVNGIVTSLETWLGHASGDIEPFNESLRQDAQRAIEARKERIEQRDAHLDFVLDS